MHAIRGVEQNTGFGGDGNDAMLCFPDKLSPALAPEEPTIPINGREIGLKRFFLKQSPVR